MGAEVSRWMIAIGAVAAWTGVIVVGMGMATLLPSDSLIAQGVVVSVVGLVALILGILIYSRTVEPDESSRS